MTIYKTEIPALKLFSRGKVRDTYDLGKHLLVISTDRVSAFDVVLREPVPYKGIVLNQLSKFWFKSISQIVKNHFVTDNVEQFEPELAKHKKIVSQRSMIVKKAKVIPIECIVRGYIFGSAWKEYTKNKNVQGISLPEGLRIAEKLPQPIFTPTTKAQTGHDKPLLQKQVEDMIGKENAEFITQKSIEIYKFASEYALKKGIIIADTKFEFGWLDDKIILIDEILTPDSSRFWPKETYKPGSPPPSLDKQFIRDYLEKIGWDKQPPPPQLPEDVIQKTSQKYVQIYRILTGRIGLLWD
jgi:phosphoribosylaminoimidazole-succinocarboxamide synthase